MIWILKCCVCFGYILFLSCDSVRPFLLSESEEIQMGNKFKAQIIADTVNYPPYRGSARVVSYIDSLGHVIAGAQNDWSTSKVNFTFTIIHDDSMVNAFAVPGGHVFLYTGLLLSAANEAQVAGVIAHEVGHITMHHSADMLVKQNAVSLISQVIFGNDSSSLVAVSSLLANLAFLKFSRNNEDEADSLSVVYTKSAGMNPQGMSQFLGVLKSQYGDSPRILEPVETALSSHPNISVRITNVDAIITKVASASTSLSLRETEYSAVKSLIKY